MAPNRDESDEVNRVRSLRRRRFEEESKVSVKVRLFQREPSKRRGRGARYGIQRHGVLMFAAYVVLALCPGFACAAEQGSGQAQPRPIVIPNRSLDPHELRDLEQKNLKRRNLEAANAARKRVIDDETNKLLILARDLKAKTESLGNGALTPTMVREAEVIQFLANDVKEEMKLTVGAD